MTGGVQAGGCYVTGSDPGGTTGGFNLRGTATNVIVREGVRGHPGLAVLLSVSIAIICGRVLVWAGIPALRPTPSPAPSASDNPEKQRMIAGSLDKESAITGLS